MLTLVTYLWKVHVNDFYEGEEHRLARFFGLFYSAIGLLTIIFQGTLTRALLSRRSLHVPLLTMPVTFVISGVAILLLASPLALLIAISAAKSMGGVATQCS